MGVVVTLLRIARFESQLSRRNCQTFSTGLSSGHLGGSRMMVMLAGTIRRRHVPAGLVDQEDGVGGGCDGRGDLREVQVHRLGLQVGRIRAAPLPCFGQTAPKM